ncbi:hypothetical protein EU805_15785 [Salipiger sp. IMCC34102]|uniref:sulfotransferase family 2 domain-containing protein n=1 Tax=Salipiger sp. IMCC34102 TaxID=2510647 RepID=UPI00101D8926|nr:sulfotransferase family 2 domain-containing protein [Salipiger sp. IMCC34102]RYH01058.1 hypothetical protein EU805_15785 [Salipiger sp. IMCC34102]
MPLFRSSFALIYFVHIPKAGGSSVEKALNTKGVKSAMMISKARNTETNYSKCTPQHIHADVYGAYFPDNFIDYAFTVCRNPFGRMASEYKMKVINGKEDATPSDWITTSIDRCREFPYTRDNHIRPQKYFLAPHVQKFKLEDGLQKPIAAAFKALGLSAPSKVPHSRKGPEEKLIITKRTLDLIRDFYHDDFETLGYDKTDYSAHFEIR